jgi:histidinol dehydrogenase
MGSTVSQRVTMRSLRCVSHCKSGQIAYAREGEKAQGRKKVEYLKKAQPQEEGVTQKVRDAVSEILSAVEKEGIAAVRRYSEQLDGWNPESFVVSQEEIRRAEESVDDELKGHI